MKLQRIVSRRKKGSNRHKKAVLLLQKCHEYVTNRRRDNAHKVSYNLVKNYDLIAFEKLNIEGLKKNRRLSKRICDAGWRELIEFTTYKAEEAGKEVRLVAPKNTTQLCSECGQIVKKDLSVRVHRCDCGYVAHRDVNDARNILHRALGHKPEEQYGQLTLPL